MGRPTRSTGSPWRAARYVVLLIGLLAAVLLPVFGPVGATPAAAQEAVPELLYFGADGCPYCAQMEVFLDELEEELGDEVAIVRHEVSGDPAARQRWEDELRSRGHTPSGVPTIVFGEQVWIGFDDQIAADIRATVERRVEAAGAAEEPADPAADDVPTTLSVPLVGEVQLAERSVVGATVLIAFVDGFNPCSLWVLTVLLAMVLNAGVRRSRIVAVGGTFLGVTAAVYGAFIAGMFTILGFVDRLDAIRMVIGLLALVVGAINMKEFVAFGRGPSLTIPDRFKPRIYRGGRAIRNTQRSLPAVLLTTVLLAGGVALVELPCTAGFPVIWTGLLRTQGIEQGGTFVALLALYLFVYLLLELIIFLTVVATLRLGSFQERHGRLLKLVGGALMVALGVVMLVQPTLLDDLGGLLVVSLGAIMLAALLAAIDRTRSRARR